MTALARAQEHLRAARRELEAAASEVKPYDIATARFLSAEIQELRRRLESIQRAVGDLDPDSPEAA